MNRILFVLYLSLLALVILFFTSLANAQTDFASCVVRPFDPLCQVMGPVYRQRAEIKARGAAERRIRETQSIIDLYGVRDYAGQAIAPAIIGTTTGQRSVGTSRTKAGVISGVVTGGVTYGVTRDWKGALAAGATSGVMSVIFAGGVNRDGKQADCSKPIRKQKDWERETCAAIAAEQQAAIVQQQVAAQQDEAQRLAQTYYNRTGCPVDVRDAAGNLVADIPNGGSVDLPESSGGYRAYMRLPAAPGKTAFRQADQRLAKDGSGFVFIFPVEGGI